MDVYLALSESVKWNNFDQDCNNFIFADDFPGKKIVCLIVMYNLFRVMKLTPHPFSISKHSMTELLWLLMNTGVTSKWFQETASKQTCIAKLNLFAD